MAKLLTTLIQHHDTHEIEARCGECPFSVAIPNRRTFEVSNPLAAMRDLLASHRAFVHHDGRGA